MGEERYAVCPRDFASMVEKSAGLFRQRIFGVNVDANRFAGSTRIVLQQFTTLDKSKIAIDLFRKQMQVRLSVSPVQMIANSQNNIAGSDFRSDRINDFRIIDGHCLAPCVRDCNQRAFCRPKWRKSSSW